MLVTIFSDASYCPKIKRASWGGWVKSERGVARGGGVLRGTISDINISEARALVNAVHLGLRDQVLHKGDRIIAQTDNDCVMKVLNYAGPRDEWRETAELARKLLGDHQLELTWRHVKGHKGYTSKRSSVNVYCDRVARYFLDEVRSEVAPNRFRRKTSLTPPYGI